MRTLGLPFARVPESRPDAQARSHRKTVPGAALLAALSGALTVTAGLGRAAESGASQDVTVVADALAASGATAAGRTPAFFGVSNSGAATYRIPIWSPPGIGAVGLDLALVYNSRGANGVVGQGWSISGLSAITRCNRTVAQDGAPAAVTNTLADRYCLDGQQLKLVSGSYGMPGSVYATEIESFSRIVASGTAGNGPASFTVTSKHGLVYDYGTTTDSQVYAGTSGTIRTWALASVRDRAGVTGGNSIAISYANDARNGAYTTGTYRVSSIAYPTTATGSGPYYRVSFSYSARPVTDVVAGYLAGNAVQEKNQLDSIAIQDYASGTVIKSYRLSYAPGPVSGRLQLRSVQECSATNCLAPTTIVYQGGALGWNTAYADTGYRAAYKASVLPVDLNGDGLTDLLYPVGLGGSVMRWWVSFARPGGFGPPVDTGVSADASAKLIPGRFLGNGRMQFLIPQGSYWTLLDYNGTAFQQSSTGLALGGEFAAGDIDGDGLDDLISISTTVPVAIQVRRNITQPAAGSLLATFASNRDTAWTVTRGTFDAWAGWRVVDLNGDGRADIVAHTYTTSKRGGSWLTPLISNGFGVPFTVGVQRDFWQDAPLQIGDWNGDGCSDVLQATFVLVSNCAGDFSAVATGATNIVYDISGLATLLPADWDEDGRTDLLYVSSGGWYVARSTGIGAAAPVATGLGAANSTAWFVLDADGDGATDLAYRDDGHNGALRYHLHRSLGVPADLATSFTDGFGMTQGPGYVSIATANYTKDADAVFPEVDFQGPLYVVNQFTASDGTGGTYQNQMQYYGARAHLQGRGFEGFRSLRTYDTRAGTYTFDFLRREFPYTGMRTQRSVLQSNLSTKVREWNATLSQQALGSGAERRLFAYVATVTDARYEIGGALDGVLVAQSSATYAYGDGYGNVTQVQRSVTDKDPGSPFQGGSWQSTSITTYANDTTTNCLGLPASTSLTQSAPGQATQTRTTAYTVDTGACRISQQVLEPGSPTLKVTTTFAFDACGNLNAVQVVGAMPDGSAMPPRTARFQYGARCQLPEAATNALGQTTSVGYQYDFGVPSSVTDANGITTRWQYDDLGRRVLETRPDQTTTSWSFESCAAGPCWGANDLRFHVYQTSKGAAAEIYDQREFLYDGFDRLRSRQYMRALGIWTTETESYDSLGRLVTRSRPYSGASNGYVAWTYDLLGRATTQKLYQSNGALDRTTAFAYAGRTVRVTDPLGHARTQVVDVAGRLRRLIDPSPGGTTSYDYDSFGGLVRAQDAIGAVSTGRYNLRGFRTQWSDADRGTWTYAADSLNELVSWTDARGQAFGATYDALGRLTSRSEPGGTSTWAWGSSPAAHNVGRLQSVAGYGYAEGLAYDGSGRLTTRTITTDQSYRFDYAYNTIGALDTIAYPDSPVPAGQSGARFTVKYGYSYGAPSLISDVTQSPARTLWALIASNDYESATSERLGANVLAVASAYKPWTGELTGRQSGAVPATNNRQNLGYQWDAAGNLTQRLDANLGLTETFSFDTLDRVQSSMLNGAANLSIVYDASGDITGRSDVGTYTYGDPTHPHAVTAVGGHSYNYDANGNQVMRDGALQAWASFNLPLQLAQPIGGTTYLSQFSYGPDHQRWKQVASYSNGTETTLYMGGLLEKESTTSTGKTYWRHYVYTPTGMVIVVSRNSDASSSTSYVLDDHLGSSDVVLDSSGNVLARESYSAFGARRGGDWSSGSPPDWTGIANTTRHGYTGHEHLDNLLLIHMNGRVYDPTVGRFLSVDPMGSDPTDSQSLNPYAYVGNRPLVSTDPSGYCIDGCIVEGMVLSSLAGTVFGSALNSITGGHALPPPPATALPGQSAQSGMNMCGPGQATPACGGWVLSAAAPASDASDVPTSSWVNEVEPGDPYAGENLEQLFVDLGYNAIDVLILAPYYEAIDAYEAAKGGHYAGAALNTGLVVCDVSKACEGVAVVLKPLVRTGKGLRSAGRIARGAARPGTEVVQRAMSRPEVEAMRRTGLVRGGRPGTHYASDAISSDASRARQRLALDRAPEVRVTMEVPAGTFSAPSRVRPASNMPGGGTERTAVGDIPARILQVDEY